MAAEMTLYEIAQEHRAMVEQLMDTNADEQCIKDTIEAESWPLAVKAQNVAYAVRNLESLAEQIKQAEAQMEARRRTLQNQATRVRGYLFECMKLAGMSRIECTHFQLAIKNNPPSVVIDSASQVPLEYMRQPPTPPLEPDKARIAAALKANKEVPGARLVQSERLEIK